MRETIRNPASAEEHATILRGKPNGADMHYLVGARHRGSWEEADRTIRAAWPKASAHGSVINWHWSEAYGEVLGEAWPVRGTRRDGPEEWWYRVLTPTGLAA